MWPPDFAVRRSMKSNGQYLYSDFTESPPSEAAMTRTGLLPSPEPLSEAKRPPVGRIPSPKPPTKPLSEAKRPCVAQLPSLELPAKLPNEVGRPPIGQFPSPRHRHGHYSTPADKRVRTRINELLTQDPQRTECKETKTEEPNRREPRQRRQKAETEETRGREDSREGEG